MRFMKLFEEFKDDDFHLSLFINKPKLQYWLSPGPMKISEDWPHEDYSFDVGKHGKYVMDVPSDEDLRKSKESRKRTYRDIAAGKVAWWTPGGYHFGVRFIQDGEDTLVRLQGRPSSAVGASPVFKEYRMKGWSTAACEKEAKKYTYGVVRKLLKEHDGKPVTFK